MIEDIDYETIICSHADDPNCSKCEHAMEHYPIEEFGLGLCHKEGDYCGDVGDDVICIPVKEFKMKGDLKKIKRHARRKANGIMNDIFKGL